jgi:hypothetical protein
MYIGILKALATRHDDQRPQTGAAGDGRTAIYKLKAQGTSCK